jgi:hypothetical protein
MKGILAIAFFCILQMPVFAQREARAVDVGLGWASNSVNAVVFRKNSLVTFHHTQFIAYYDADGFVILGKRKLGSKNWQLKKTAFRGRVQDAHNTISIMTDGDGYLHLSWDHHNNQLHYSRSLQPESLEMAEPFSMTGKNEGSVSYPEFYRLADGNLLFIYRDGGSGRGNLVMNKYNTKTKQWTQLHSNLIDGEKQRSAYWQATTDAKGTIHLSWVWRETPDVASNHDLCYARSTDGGLTWESSTGKKYTLPITAANAEIACPIPQKSELINQTSMYADKSGFPYIATYWRDSSSSVPQFRLVFRNKDGWHSQNLGFRSTAFSLSGAGTKRIPISRPQIIAWQKGKSLAAAMIFRDEERDNKISAAVCKDLTKGEWKVIDLYQEAVDSWEPTYDTELWKEQGKLNLFVQKVEQVDAEGQAKMPPQMVKVLEWNPQD